MHSILQPGWKHRPVILLALTVAGGIAYWQFGMRLPPHPQQMLRIGFEQSPPFAIRDGGRFTSLALDTVNKGARRAALHIEWMETGTGSEEALQKRLVDIWPLVADLPERRKLVDL